MQDGKALQYATSHNLGQKGFSKAFDIKYLDKQNKEQYGWQTSWGLSTRSIGGLIMVHSDDLGLVLPPKMAPIQVVITTITQKENEKEIMDKADEISKELQNSGARVKIDNDDLTPGEKFFKWEKKGVPIRIEIGEKELKNKEVVCVTRHDGNKINIQFNEISKIIINMLDQIQKDIYERALKKQNESIKNAQDWDDLVEKVSKGNFVLAFFCCEKNIEKQINEDTGITVRCIKQTDGKTKGICIKTGKETTNEVYFAKSY